MQIDYDFILKSLPDIAKYIPVTLELVLVSFLLSFFVGTVFAWINYRRVKLLSSMVRLYMSLIRGTPVILQIYVIYNVTPYLLASLFEKMGSTYNVYKLNPIWYAFFALSLSATVSLAEALRAGLETVNKGQLEAGLSVGMSRIKTMYHVIFPQALAASLPVIGNVLVELTKATSLAFIMSVMEITGRAKVVGAGVLRYFEAYVCVFLLYILIIVILEQILKLAEKRVTVFRRGRHIKA